MIKHLWNIGLKILDLKKTAYLESRFVGIKKPKEGDKPADPKPAEPTANDSKATDAKPPAAQPARLTASRWAAG